MTPRKPSTRTHAVRTQRRPRRLALDLEPLEGRSLLSTTTTLTPTQATLANQILIQEDYQIFLGRQADSVGLAGWTNVLAFGVSPAVVSRDFATSTAALTRDVNLAYQHDLGRAPSTTELNSGIAALQGPGDAADILDARLLSSPEFFAKAGGTNQGYVQALYGNVFGLAGDPAGVAAWTGLLNRGASRSQVATDFLTSQERATDQVVGAYWGLLGRAPEAAGLNFWVNLRQSHNGQAPAIDEQTLLIDVLNSPENLGRIDALAAKDLPGTSAQFASGLLDIRFLNPGAAFANFDVEPEGISFIASGVNSPVTITLQNRDTTQPLVFTPAIGVSTFYPIQIPADAFTFLDSTGKPLTGPITVAPGQTATFQIVFDSSKVSVNASTFMQYGAELVLFNSFGRQLVPPNPSLNVAGSNGFVGINLSFVVPATLSPT